MRAHAKGSFVFRFSGYNRGILDAGFPVVRERVIIEVQIQMSRARARILSICTRFALVESFVTHACAHDSRHRCRLIKQCSLYVCMWVHILALHFAVKRAVKDAFALETLFSQWFLLDAPSRRYLITRWSYTAKSC